MKNLGVRRSMFISSYVILKNSSNPFLIEAWSFLLIKTEGWFFVSSTVPPSLYPNTGKSRATASIVLIPQLSLARLINHLACFMIEIFSWVLFTCPTKVIVGQASALSMSSSGHDHMMMSCSLLWLNSFIIRSSSLTKLVTLPTNTK